MSTTNMDNNDDDSLSFSKRVPVSIRYSSESGLRPYFLTAAKRIKETFPDVLLERVVLPRNLETSASVDSSSSSSSESTAAVSSAIAGSVFEVLVDGKPVIRSPGRKLNINKESTKTVFVSMQELDVAIARARRKRRPSTVYGDVMEDSVTLLDDGEDGASRLQLLKNKAYEISKSQERSSKKNKDY